MKRKAPRWGAFFVWKCINIWKKYGKSKIINVKGVYIEIKYMKYPVFDTTPEISQRMSNMPSKGGLSEIALEKELWNRGIRYRKNYKSIPGSPDIAITKMKIAIFIDGEFWHGENWEDKKKKIKSNRDYWIAKIEGNMARDQINDKKLKDMGWTPIHFWDKEVKKNVKQCADKIVDIMQIKYAEQIEL